jgi:hypothetical protein
VSETPATGSTGNGSTRRTLPDCRAPQRHEPQSHHLSKACFFNGYGTAASGCRDVLEDSPDRLTAPWRDKQLQYTWLRADTRISGRSLACARLYIGDIRYRPGHACASG